jgi:UDP-N-acetylmuramate dehydrogenase
MVERLTNALLAPYTTLGVGGPADLLVITNTYHETLNELRSTDEPLWFLGYGSNCLISDEGLRGTTIIWRGGDITHEGEVLTVDAGVLWDDLVKYAIDQRLWGFELMSEIPSTVGGAVFGNIAAYGQQVSDTLQWVEIYDTKSKQTYTLQHDDITFAYRQSSLQSEPHRKILRAGFKLSAAPLHTLKYDSALAIANELNLDPSKLEDCRKIIVETRTRAGSIYHYDDPNAEKTAGSFFKNPLLSVEQARMVASFDETGKTIDRIINQSKIHGGNAQRASAAHVLFATGFHRGQTWGNVRLHQNHVLKIETLPGATAQNVYDVTQEIIKTVKEKLDINLEPEVKFLGKF